MSEVPELLTIDESRPSHGRQSSNTVVQGGPSDLGPPTAKRAWNSLTPAGQMRVPRRRLEKKLRITIDRIPPPRVRNGPERPTVHSGKASASRPFR